MLCIVICKGETRNTVICDIDNQYTKYVLALKGTKVIYLDLSLHTL